MNQPNHAEVGRRAEEIYESSIRSMVEPGHTGAFVVIDIDTGDYELDANEVAAVRRMEAKRPDGTRYIKRIGFHAAHRLGGRFPAGQQ
jgi:hypothetical protein